MSQVIINVSASQEAEGLGLRLFTHDQSAVVVNGIDLDEMDRVIRQSAIRRETLGIGPDDFVIGCVSRWDPVKRFEILLQAVRQLADRLPRLTLLLVGGGGERHASGAWSPSSVFKIRSSSRDSSATPSGSTASSTSTWRRR